MILPAKGLCYMSGNNQPLVLVPLLHGGNVLVKSLSVLIAKCPEIFWEEV